MTSAYPYASYYGPSAYVKKAKYQETITFTTQHETTTAAEPHSTTQKCDR